MKKIMVILLTCIFSTALFAQKANVQNVQNVSNIGFINELADKNTVTYADGVRFFLIVTGESPKSFQENINILDNEGITSGIKLEEDSPLKRGPFSLMIARYLKLKDSLMYSIFGTERYAYRACIANGIMNFDGSEWENLSGGEVIEIMTRVSEKTGGNE